MLLHTDKDGQSALHMATKKGHLDIVRILLMHNADVNIKGKVSIKTRFTGYFMVLQIRMSKLHFI